VDGRVIEVTKDRIVKIKAETENLKSQSKTSSQKDSTIFEYQIPPEMAIWVEPGKIIRKGEQLCEGNIDLKELFKLVGVSQTQLYIIKEVQRIYVSQGVLIHDKHIEVIVRQMFSRLRINDPGDSSLVTGEIISKARFLEELVSLKRESKKPKAVPVLLGISQIALTTDSFLSAASFQETSRVLIRAAIEAREDKLMGLKENVIIGKLIPVGTGFKK
jgi:DNA-directed RNA polymerase subunit beta'